MLIPTSVITQSSSQRGKNLPLETEGPRHSQPGSSCRVQIRGAPQPPLATTPPALPASPLAHALLANGSGLERVDDLEVPPVKA